MNEPVLVVDDSLTVRMNLAEALAAAGFDPRPCATVAEARGALARERFALVVLDVLLPDGDGIELLGEIRRSESASLPVMLLSTESEVRDRIRGMRTGADEYVGKPYDVAFIVSRARELARASPHGSTTGKDTILVIDDSATFREALRAALEAEGNDVAVASTGEQGLRVAADIRPAAIVVDGLLPGIDGATVIRRLRLDAALRGTPVLLLTASEDEGAELRALDAGADAFVRKEDDVSIILARIAAVMRTAKSRAEESATSSLLGPKRILAVDDSATYLHELTSALGGEGYDVVLARSGEEALELLAVQSVDCILLDLVMPGLNGQETCRRIKTTPILRDIPLILLTALDEREAMLEGLGAGADDYITKSSDFEVLRARVRAQIRRRQFEDENRRFREQLLRMEIEASEARAARELAATRAALVEELESKNRELETFSYYVSHDLRAPLRAINGFARILLEDHASELTPDAAHCLHAITRNSAQMGALIDDLLAFSRLSRQAHRMQTVEPADLVAQIVDEMHADLERRPVEISVGELPECVADRALLRQVFANLLSNAVKFTRGRDPARIEVGWRDAGGEGVYFVKDNGVGFDMRYADKVFGVFQRLHRAEEYEGTGVGMAIVQHIIQRHGGRIWADSEIGRGTTFSFVLPEASEDD
jgi:DNA-binding response OmpR family regulator